MRIHLWAVILMVLLLGRGAVVPDPQDARQEPVRPSELDPARPLSAEEAEKLVAQVVVLLDKKADKQLRLRAVRILEEKLRHRAALPALRFLIHDEAENASLRAKAMDALLFIGLEEAVGDLLKLLRSEDGDVRFWAWERLCWQYPKGLDFGFDRAKSVEENEEAIKRWEEWWDGNKDTFQVKTSPLLFEH